MVEQHSDCQRLHGSRGGEVGRTHPSGRRASRGCSRGAERRTFRCTGGAGVSEWHDADRSYGGVELFQAGKAPLLVFTGGWAPWEPKARPEGDILIDYAKALGVPSGNMLTTGTVANTASPLQNPPMPHWQRNSAEFAVP